MSGIYYNGVSQAQYGIPLLGGEQYLQTGLTYFVHESGSGGGGSPDDPIATIDGAINLLTDVTSSAHGPHTIVVLAGHTEAQSADGPMFDLDINGVNIYGLGIGPMRPQLALDTDPGATIDVAADGVSMSNLLFLINVDDLVSVLDIDTTNGLLMEALEFRDQAAVACIDTCEIDGEADIVFRNCRWDETSTGDSGQSCILGGTPPRLVIDGCYFDKDAQTGAVELGSVVGCTITNNLFNMDQGGESLGIVLGTPVGGYIHNNYVRQLDSGTFTGAIDTAATGVNLGQNWITNENNESGGILITLST